MNKATLKKEIAHFHHIPILFFCTPQLNDNLNWRCKVDNQKSVIQSTSMLNTCSSPCVKRHWSVKNKDIRITRFPCSNSLTLTSFMHDTCERVRESEEKTKKKQDPQGDKWPEDYWWC